MGRTIIAGESHQTYLKKCAEENEFGYGLIIGQPNVQKKDYIIHVAKTKPPEENPKDSEESQKPSTSTSSQGKFKESDFDAILNHILTVTKLLPGSFYVLGIFIIDKEFVFSNETAMGGIKSCLRQARRLLDNNIFIAGKRAIEVPFFVLSYSTTSYSCSSKSYSENFMSLDHVELLFVEKILDWKKFETNYEFDDMFPLKHPTDDRNIESTFAFALETLNSYIVNSEVYIEHEQVDPDTIVENHVISDENRKLKRENKSEEGYNVNVFLPMIPSKEESIKVERFPGTISFFGVIGSRIWVHPKTTFRDVIEYVLCDITRSLTSRIQIYCDSIADSNRPNDIVQINEPPRRVFYGIPYSSDIQFCEYIFRYETVDVLPEQIKNNLDISVLPSDIDTNAEGLPSYDDNVSVNSESSFEIRRHVYIAGIVIAILVLCLSVFLHFLFNEKYW